MIKRIVLALFVGIFCFVYTYIIGSEEYIDLDAKSNIILMIVGPVLAIILATTIYYFSERR